MTQRTIAQNLIDSISSHVLEYFSTLPFLQLLQYVIQNIKVSHQV